MKITLLIVVLLTFNFISCTKTKTTDSIPVITISSPLENDSISTPKINIDFKVKDEVDLSTVTIELKDEESKILFSKSTLEISSPTYNYSNFLTINSNTKTKTLELGITATNEFGNKTEKKIKFNVLPQPN